MRVATLILLTAVLAGCKKEEPATTNPMEPPSAPAATVAPSIAAPSAASANMPSSASAEGDSLPTEEDFEDEVNRTITSKNLDEELDKLEKEIGKSP